MGWIIFKKVSRTYYVPGTVLGAGDTELQKAGFRPLLIVWSGRQPMNAKSGGLQRAVDPEDSARLHRGGDLRACASWEIGSFPGPAGRVRVWGKNGEGEGISDSWNGNF